MPRTPLTPRESRRFTTDEARWQAVVDGDPRADGLFWYSVVTTGVYCRPSCGARLPRRGNVRFHASPSDAEAAGFRPCLRCRPGESDPGRAHDLAVERACRMMAESEAGPSLDELAAAASMSPSHFRRVFKERTGLTPKTYASAQRAHRVRKALVAEDTVTSALYAAGFNSSGRFYEKSTETLGMTPTEYRSGGGGMTIRYATAPCPLGFLLVAATDRGVCAISLGDSPEALVRELRARFPNASITRGGPEFDAWIASTAGFIERPAAGLSLPLDIQGTAFQHRVWRRLREIPCGATANYEQIAADLGAPGSSRAVARACASNPAALVVPCHRVIRKDGGLAGYRWGIDRKAKLLETERRTARRQGGGKT